MKGVLLAMAGVVAASCVQDRTSDNKPASGEATVTISVQLPVAAIPATRALAEADENEVAEIDILAFEPGGAYVFTGQCTGSQIATDPGNNARKTFTARLREGTFDLVVLANSRELLDDASLAGKTKADALASLTETLPAGGKWVANPLSSDYKPFPMWGEADNVTVNSGTNLTGDRSVKLIRMMARIDVRVDEAVTNFELTEVHLLNYHTQGHVAPITDGSWDAGAGVAIAPSVPAAATVTLGPLSYTGAEINTATNSCVGEIYMFEFENHGEPSHTLGNSKELLSHIVVGGDYGNSGTTTYYRLDFTTPGEILRTYFDLLRNHQYVFDINAVSGPGYATVDEASAGDSFNISSNFVISTGHSYFVQNLHSVLVINKKDFLIDSSLARIGEQEDNDMTVYSAYTDGWTIEGIVDAADGTTPATWITPSITEGPDSRTTHVTLNITANGTGADRTAIMLITAGRLKAQVTVTQRWTSPDNGAHFLYFDENNNLKVGAYMYPDNTPGPATVDKLAFFKFGSVIGVRGAADWDNSNIVYNPSKYVVGTDITNFSVDVDKKSLPGIPGFEATDYTGDFTPLVSDRTYHNGANIRKGKGDPCQLAGFDLRTLAGMSEPEAEAALGAYDSGWRMPSETEWIYCIGGSPANATWKSWHRSAYPVNSPTIFVYTNGPSDGSTTWPFWYDSNNTPSTTSTGGIGTARFPVADNGDIRANMLIIPAGGYLGYAPSGYLLSQGSYGAYWTSLPIRRTSGISGTDGVGLSILITNSTIMTQDESFSFGFNVRCVRTTSTDQ